MGYRYQPRLKKLRGPYLPDHCRLYVPPSPDHHHLLFGPFLISSSTRSRRVFDHPSFVTSTLKVIQLIQLFIITFLFFFFFFFYSQHWRTERAIDRLAYHRCSRLTSRILVYDIRTSKAVCSLEERNSVGYAITGAQGARGLLTAQFPVR